MLVIVGAVVVIHLSVTLFFCLDMLWYVLSVKLLGNFVEELAT